MVRINRFRLYNVLETYFRLIVPRYQTELDHITRIDCISIMNYLNLSTLYSVYLHFYVSFFSQFDMNVSTRTLTEYTSYTILLARKGNTREVLFIMNKPWILK